MRIRFITGNTGKVAEAQRHLARLGHTVEATPMDLPELQADDLETVARHKVARAAQQADPPLFVEDAGLFVEELGGFPGVYSAYAYSTIGCAGVLRLLDNKKNRAATFRAVVAYMDDEAETHLLVGQCPGRIADEAAGDNGFGFDPIFVPAGHDKTFAELEPEAKDAVSHRGRALEALADLLGHGKETV